MIYMINIIFITCVMIGLINYNIFKICNNKNKQRKEEKKCSFCP